MEDKLTKDILAILRAKYNPGMETFSFLELMVSLQDKGYSIYKVGSHSDNYHGAVTSRKIALILHDFGMFAVKRGSSDAYRFNRWVMTAKEN